MWIQTLNYIHELLINNENETKKAKYLTYKARNKAEDEGTDNYKELCELYEKEKESWNKAYDVLKDFEEHEWR